MTEQFKLLEKIVKQNELIVWTNKQIVAELTKPPPIIMEMSDTAKKDLEKAFKEYK